MVGKIVHYINNFPLGFFVRGHKRILDIGCGVNSPINYFVSHAQELDGVDISSHDVARQSGTKYKQIFVQDVREFTPPNPYDVITALDFIEHLEKEDGLRLLSRLEELANKRVVLVTPNGFVPQAAQPDNPFQEHKSGWTTEDFKARGYRVYGMFGPKSWREGTAVLKYRPKILWGILGLLAGPLYFFLPRNSFSLLAIYDKKQASV